MTYSNTFVRGSNAMASTRTITANVSSLVTVKTQDTSKDFRTVSTAMAFLLSRTTEEWHFLKRKQYRWLIIILSNFTAEYLRLSGVRLAQIEDDPTVSLKNSVLSLKTNV